MDSILKNMPAFKPVARDFEEIYTPELEAEDLAQAEASVKPYFEEQIRRELEDLNAFVEVENVNYERSLRRARFSLAARGGGIGTERVQIENEITSDHQRAINEKLRAAERDVGTKKLTEAGYASQGTNLKGDVIDKMEQAIFNEQQQNKRHRAERYYADVNRYYATESDQMMKGSKKRRKNSISTAWKNPALSYNPNYVNPLQTPV